MKLLRGDDEPNYTITLNQRISVFRFRNPQNELFYMDGFVWLLEPSKPLLANWYIRVFGKLHTHFNSTNFKSSPLFRNGGNGGISPNLRNIIMNNTMINESNKQPPVTIARFLEASNGECYFEVICGNRKYYIKVSDWIGDSKAVFQKMAKVGIIITSQADKKKFSDDIDAAVKQDRSTALVATQPGWLKTNDPSCSWIYVFPNGELITLKDFDDEVIVVFESNNSYSKLGSLDKWKQKLNELLADEPIIAFLFDFALTGALITRTSLNIPNLALELVGELEDGKSGMCKSVGSIWGGNPSSDIGIGRAAGATANAFKPLQRMNNDGLLFLDEMNLADDGFTKDMRIIFENTATDEKARYGDFVNKLPVHTTLLMTSNEPLESIGNASKRRRDAANSRLISLRLNEPIINYSLDDYDTPEAVADAVTKHADQYYGTASRKFIKSLINEYSHDWAKLDRTIERLMEQFRSIARRNKFATNRIEKMFALSYAAGMIAKRYEVRPEKFTLPMKSAGAAFMMHIKHCKDGKQSKDSGSVRKIKSVIEKNSSEIHFVNELDLSKGEELPKAKLGWCLQKKSGAKVYCFLPKRLKEVMNDGTSQLLKALKAEGVLTGENGSSPKLVSKSPWWVPTSKSTYKITLSK